MGASHGQAWECTPQLVRASFHVGSRPHSCVLTKLRARSRWTQKRGEENHLQGICEPKGSLWGCGPTVEGHCSWGESEF